MPPQHLALPGGQAGARALVARPPVEAALREALRTPPQALPILHQQCERRGRALAEDKDRAAEGVFPEALAAHRRQALEPFATLDRLGRQQHTALGGALQQQRVSKKGCSSAAMGNWGARQWMRQRAPSARGRSTSVAGGGHVQTEGEGTSTKLSAGAVASRERARGCLAQCCCSVVLCKPKRLATSRRGNCVVQGMACCHSSGGIGAARWVRVSRQWVKRWATCSHSASASLLVSFCLSASQSSG